MSSSVGRILIVDDEEMIRALITRHLTARGHACESAGEGRHALALASTGAFDVVLADVKMPGLDGLALAREIQRSSPTVPVVLVTGNTSFETAVRAMRHGACDIVVKPFQFEVLDQAVERALARRRALKDAEEYRRILEKKLEEKTATAALAMDAGKDAERLRDAFQRMSEDFDAVAVAVASALEMRMGEPRGRSRRLRSWAETLACRAGMASEGVRDVAIAAVLRDFGRIGLSDADARTDREFPQRGARMLEGCPSMAGAAKIVRAMRERWDGTGFPQALRGEAIPLGARVVAVTIAYDDALVKAASAGPDEANESMRVEAGYSLDPRLVDLFLAIPAMELGVGSPISV